MKKFIKLALLASAVSMLSLPAQAHRLWLLPSSTVLSGAAPWVAVDAAVSNDVFYFEHRPLQLDNLTIVAPDGKAIEAQNAAKGAMRSTFDIKLEQPGTYRIAITNQGVNARYKVDGQQKRWRGKADQFASAIPAGATDVTVTESLGRVETFVTAGKPSTDNLKPTGSGLELVPVTHPNNLAQGEKASFRLLIDGKPAKNAEIEVVPGGNRYRDKVNDFELKSDEEGGFTVTWPTAGMYWLSATISDDNATIKNAKRRATYSATFEVLPQ